MQLRKTDAQTGCFNVGTKPDGDVALVPMADIRIVVQGSEYGVDITGEASEGDAVGTIRFTATREALEHHIQFLLRVRADLERIAAALEAGGIRTKGAAAEGDAIE